MPQSKEERLDKMKRQPNSVRLWEALKLLADYGFKIRETRKQHHVAERGSATLTIAAPHHPRDPLLKVPYVKKIIAAIEQSELEANRGNQT